MCLAVPMEVVKIDGMRGLVRQSGVELEIGLELVDEVKIGDYVVVHAGYAIQSMPAEEAEETLAIFERIQAEGAWEPW